MARKLILPQRSRFCPLCAGDKSFYFLCWKEGLLPSKQQLTLNVVNKKTLELNFLCAFEIANITLTSFHHDTTYYYCRTGVGNICAAMSGLVKKLHFWLCYAKFVMRFRSRDFENKFFQSKKSLFD